MPTCMMANQIAIALDVAGDGFITEKVHVIASEMDIRIC